MKELSKKLTRKIFGGNYVRESKFTKYEVIVHCPNKGGEAQEKIIDLHTFILKLCNYSEIINFRDFNSTNLDDLINWCEEKLIISENQEKKIYEKYGIFV